MITHVFKVPDGDLQALVTIYDNGHVTLAFRQGYGSWGPPIRSMSDQRPGPYYSSLDDGPRAIPDHMKGAGYDEGDVPRPGQRAYEAMGKLIERHREDTEGDR